MAYRVLQRLGRNSMIPNVEVDELRSDAICKCDVKKVMKLSKLQPSNKRLGAQAGASA